jgi:hypothetical protein
MGIIDAFRTYNALGSEHADVLNTKVIRGSRTPGEWLTFLKSVAAYDRTTDSLRYVAGWGIVAGLLLAIILGIALQSLVASLVCLLIAILSIVFFVRLKRRDIPNTMRFCVLPLVALLREDMEPDAQLLLRADFTGGIRREKQAAGGGPLPKGNYISGTQTFYNDPWFEGEGTFADGSNVAWSVNDLIRQRDITKRGRSGKIKSKRKFKVRRMIDVRVGMRQDAYALADDHAAGGRGHDRIAVKEGAKRNVMKMRRILIETRPDAPLDPKHIIDLLAEAYRRVTLNQTEE